MDYLQFPKIELHLHLDCSLSYAVVKQLEGLRFSEYQNAYIAPPKCSNLNEYLVFAAKGIELMQTKEALRLTTLDLFAQLHSENVLYAEIRFAPLEHTKKGLTASQVVQTVAAALQIGMQNTGIVAGLLLCTLRHYSKAESLEAARLAVDFKNAGVVGFDIAADEAGFSVKNHIAAFEYAKAHGLNCTAHAGEACGAESVWETIRHFSPNRIGHGVRSAEDMALVQYLRDNTIHLEVCPTSNVQTNVYATMADHTIDLLYRSGVSLSINTDARTISNVSLTDEYLNLERTFNWGKEQVLACNLAALHHAFAPDAVKTALRKRLHAGFGV
jgi:adenosine deaminase